MRSLLAKTRHDQRLLSQANSTWVERRNFANFTNFSTSSVQLWKLRQFHKSTDWRLRISLAMLATNQNFCDSCQMNEIGTILIRSGFATFCTLATRTAYNSWSTTPCRKDDKNWNRVRTWSSRWNQSLRMHSKNAFRSAVRISSC